MAETIKIGGELESMATGHVVAAASAIKDKEKNRYQDSLNDDVVRHETEIHGTGGINDRLDDIEAAESITYEGGEAQIAQGSDFTNSDATKRAKIPTVGAILDGLNDGIYDVSKRNPTAGPNSDGKFTLEYILNNANTLIPTSWRHGGMTISFVDSSDNKYVQYRLMSNTWSTIVTDWQEDNSNTVDGQSLFVTDNNGNIIAKINKDGVHSVDFKVGEHDTSLITLISNEVSAREHGDSVAISLVEAEEARAKEIENTKLNDIITDNKFYFTDNNGYIICQIDANGVHSVNIDDYPEIIADDSLTIMDSHGYVVVKIDANGVHSVKDKHAVACMVLSEAYYPITPPMMDSNGNVTYVKVMFETGVVGSISVTYINGNSSSVAVIYGKYNYTIIINRDAEGNVETVSVN